MAVLAPLLKPRAEQATDRPLTGDGQHPCAGKKVWIDLDNSPHVPFFAPIIEELERSGHSILVTARDCFQVCELADLLHLRCRRVGRHYGKNQFVKMAGVCWRALQLVPQVGRYRPQLALSHGSRSQLLLANLLRIPCVTIADYEFARIWLGVRPTWVITPEVIPLDAIHCRKDRILSYPGIKEDVYVPRFRPDASIVASLGLQPSREIIAVIRPPATEAHYHRPESDVLFAAVLDFLGGRPDVKMVVLPRNEHQAKDIRTRWPVLISSRRLVIPSRVTDGLNLIWHSDLVISGGGTMNREAAALRIPVYSIFRGEIGAVDRYLAATGRLTLIERAEDLPSKLILSKRAPLHATSQQQSNSLSTIVDHIKSILEQAE